jgi:excisionase family DNA binding protein
MQTQSISFPRLGHSLAELEVLVGLSRSTLHRMVARGKLETVKRGRRRLVPVWRLYT